MKISELMKKLEQCKEECGDIEILAGTWEYWRGHVKTIWGQPDLTYYPEEEIVRIST